MNARTDEIGGSAPRKPKDLSDRYWASLTEEHRALYAVVRPLQNPAYTVDWHVGSLEEMLAGVERDMVAGGGALELEPDFQRGHVWTQAQRIAYVEAMIRKTAPTRLLFNCPGWSRTNDEGGDIAANTFQCIDGLQRLTAVRKFMRGEFNVFGDCSALSLEGSPFDLRRYRLQMCVYEFNTRAELLQFYLDLNSGGTRHEPQEIERVRALLDLARAR